MKSILCLIAGLSCIALTGCHTNSNKGAYSHPYSSGYGYSYSPQPASSQYSSITPAQAAGKYDAYTTYESGLYPQPQPAPVVTTGPSESAVGGVGSSTTSTSAGASGQWMNLPEGKTTFTPVTQPSSVTTTPQAQPKPQPQPESQYKEPQGGVSTTYSTQQGYQIHEKRHDKSGPPYSAYRGTDEHWYDPEW